MFIVGQSSGAPMQTATAQIFTRSDLLDQCEPSLRTSVPPGSDSMDEDVK